MRVTFSNDTLANVEAIYSKMPTNILKEELEHLLSVREVHFLRCKVKPCTHLNYYNDRIAIAQKLLADRLD